MSMSVTLKERTETVLNFSGTSSDQSVLDLEHLAKYTLGDQALQNEVLELFCAHSHVQMDQLRAAAGIPVQWYAAAHGIKGSARGVGAWALAQAAEHAERDMQESAAIHMRHVELLQERLAATHTAIEQRHDAD